MSWPSGHVANDVAILTLESSSYPGNIGSGWQEVHASPVYASGSNGVSVVLSVYWKRASSGSETDASVTGLGNQASGVILTYKNCVTSGYPIDMLNATSKNTASTSTSLSGEITNHSCNDVLYVAARAGNNGSAQQYSGEVDANLVNLIEKVDGA